VHKEGQNEKVFGGMDEEKGGRNTAGFGCVAETGRGGTSSLFTSGNVCWGRGEKYRRTKITTSRHPILGGGTGGALPTFRYNVASGGVSSIGERGQGFLWAGAKKKRKRRLGNK